MIKKYLSIIFVIFLFFFISPNFIFGQTQTPNSFFNKNCGIADTEFKKCCIQEEKKPAFNIPIPSIDIKSMVHEKLNEYGLGLIGGECLLGKPDYSSGQCICVQQEQPTPIDGYKKLCENYFKNNQQHQAFCLKCIEGGGYYSGLGCVPINLANFISNFLLGRLIGLAGILAFFCIIYAAFMMQSSQGNQEKLKKSQELLTSCIMGLIFIIFSVFILKLIGVDILKIPGLK